MAALNIAFLNHGSNFLKHAAYSFLKDVFFNQAWYNHNLESIKSWILGVFPALPITLKQSLNQFVVDIPNKCNTCLQLLEGI